MNKQNQLLCLLRALTWTGGMEGLLQSTALPVRDPQSFALSRSKSASLGVQSISSTGLSTTALVVQEDT